MNEEFQEPIRKKVGGSLSNIPPLQRLAMLQANARFLRGAKKWSPPPDDGTLVRKVVGWPLDRGQSSPDADPMAEKSPTQTGSPIVPCLRYVDAPAALDWLCRVFGFEKKMVIPGDEPGTVAHAELTLGRAMIMAGSKSDSAYSRSMKSPKEVGGVCTQSIYLVLPEVDTLYERVKAAGAPLVMDIRDQDYGGRDFTCQDVEGHLWTFGTYDPWA